MYIEKINSPEDLKKLSIDQLKVVCEEIRTIILNKVSKYGGHVGPDLGVVEVTVAMHYVFNSPVDQIVYDVSHQSFAHKILTGRRDAFINNEVSEYTNPKESPHDFFIVGHTSTSMSMCCGLMKGRDLKKDKYNVVGLIGDGALSGGEAFEGLDNFAQIGTNMIIVVNDNQWAIAENHGGIYKNLKDLRDSDGKCECNYFKALDLDYMYQPEGNDVGALIKTFQSVKDIDHPIVVHIKTLKGMGYEPAIKDEEDFHYSMPFDLKTGKPLKDLSDYQNYGDMTGKFLMNKLKYNPEMIVISSATPQVIGFTPEVRKEAGSQFIDVGIAEEHGVAFSSGLAKSGVKPVYAVYGTFLQRSFDQLSEDLCMQDNPATLLVFLTGVYGIPDQSHQCFFDIIEISNIPNMIYLAPVCMEEYFAMLEWGTNYKEHPVAIRVPTNGVHSIDMEFEKDYSQINKFKIMRKGEKVAIIAVGSFYQFGETVAKQLEDKYGIKATIINPRYLTGVDAEALDALKKDHQLVITLEDGITEGGYGEKIAGYLGTSALKVKNYGFRKEFVDRYNAADLMKANGITDVQIADDIMNLLK